MNKCIIINYDEFIDLEKIKEEYDNLKKTLESSVIVEESVYNQITKIYDNNIDKLNRIVNLLYEHEQNTGDLYYKYNNKFLKSEFKEQIRKVISDKR